MARKPGLSVNPNDLKRLKSKMRALALFPEELQKSMQQNGRGAVEKMKQLAPKDTGRLEREIEYTTTANSITLTSEAIDPDTGIDYAPSQEYGGRHFSAQPYFRPGVRWLVRNLSTDISRRIKKL